MNCVVYIIRILLCALLYEVLSFTLLAGHLGMSAVYLFSLYSKCFRLGNILCHLYVHVSLFHNIKWQKCSHCWCIVLKDSSPHSL